ncbi:MAG: GFA family protein [Stellaceae bacterium]
MAQVRTGGCLCGAIRYEAAGEPLFSLQCHCRDCQRASGAGHVPAVRLPSADFRVTKGTPKSYIAKSDAGNDISRVFCGDCGTPLYVQVSTRPDMVGLRVTTFDDPSWFKPEANIFTKSAQPWDHMDPAVPAFETYPQGKSYSR